VLLCYRVISNVQLIQSCLRPACLLLLLQLLAVAGDFPTSPGWLADALSSLQPQLPSLEALAALLLLQSLKAFRSQPPASFMAALQQRLLQLVHKFDAMGVATMLQGLVACGAPPSVELQAVLAGHIKKGLARPSQVRQVVLCLFFALCWGNLLSKGYPTLLVEPRSGLSSCRRGCCIS
jgi:hypothetical protein